MVVVSLNKQIDTSNTEVFFRRSINNGTNWDAIQRITNASGRSEDPAISAQGNNIHISWNDKRSGIMQIYYRRSTDAGVTWGPETQLTNASGSNSCYTTMVSLDGTNADVPYGYSIGGIFHIWFRQSSNNGLTFAPEMQLTSGTVSQVYPYLVRSGSRLHLVYPQIGTGTGTRYIYSSDGGATWDTPVTLSSTGFQPFIAYSGCVLHVIWPDSGKIYYKRNPTGNCGNTSGITGLVNASNTGLSLSASPNIFSQSTKIKFTLSNYGRVSLKIFDIQGREVETLVNGILFAGKYEVIWKSSSSGKLSSGVYFYKLEVNDFSITKRLLLVK